jgi:hypothetical protein
MKLVSVSTRVAGSDSELVRTAGQVRLDDGEEFEIFFETSAELREPLSRTANPWIVAMLPYALSKGERIISDIPADPQLLENLRGLAAVWCKWYPQFSAPEIIAPLIPLSEAAAPEGRSAAFFSGGIDSWFTVLRHAPELEPNAVGQVDDLITVHGFDIPVESPGEFAKLQKALARAAETLNRRLIVIKTNLRRTGSLWAKGWGWLTHAAGLATVALILENRYTKALIGSAFPYASLIPWGSHPMTDALFSTRALEIKHDGAAYNRVEKTALIARHKVALSHLHVCWRTGSASNCGECAKCMRTMATLELLGVLKNCCTFPPTLEAEKLARLYIENSVEAEFFKEIHGLAVRTGNSEIQSAAARALRRSDRIRPAVRLADKLKAVPIAWRLGPRMRQWLVR